MNTVTIEGASREESNARFQRAMGGEPQGNFITFPSHRALWASLTANR